jgi:hypothetical protein
LDRKVAKGQSIGLRVARGSEEREIPGVVLSFDRAQGFISLEIEGEREEKISLPKGKEVTIVGRMPDSDLDIPCVVADGSQFPVVICRGVDRRDHLRVNTFLNLTYRLVERELLEMDPEALLLRIQEEMGDGDGAFEPLSEELDLETLNPKLLALLESMSKKLDRILSLLQGAREGDSPGVIPVNISGSGLRFAVRERMKAKEVLAVRIVLPLTPPVPVVFLGEVRRVRKKRDGEFEIAVKFMIIDELDREKIVHYTFKRMRESIRNRKIKGP